MFANKLYKALALPPGGVETVIPQGALAVPNRFGRDRMNLDVNSWFGPGQPMRPNGPESLLPRNWDYPFSSNLNIRPRSEQNDGPTFDQLRQMARVTEIVRLCIETRKDQISKMPWTFRLKRKQGESYGQTKKKSQEDKRVQQLIDFFRNPDKSPEHSFQSWIRMVLEEIFVTDALTILPRKNLLGDVLMLEIIDGATIKKLIDPEGRVPAPPDPAYQQIIKGIAAKNLTTDDILYRPRNPVVNRFYGYSPVEQIMLTMNVMVRRVLSQLAFYTDGNIPEMIVSAPDDWSSDQIGKFQAMFDTLAGNTEVQRRLRFIPGGKTIVATKSDALLTNETDEWFTRMVCYCFSLPPTPFVKMMNRATSGNLQQSALEEGLLPLQLWLADTINACVSGPMKITDIEFAWSEQEEADQLKQAQIDKLYVSIGKQSVDELRERDGEDPIGVGHYILTGTGPVFLDGTITPTMQRQIDQQELTNTQNQDKIDNPAPVAVGAGATGAGKKTATAEKSKKKVLTAKADATTDIQKRSQRDIEANVSSKLLDVREDITSIVERYSSVNLGDIEHILSPIDFSSLVESTRDNLKTIYADEATEQLADIGITESGIFDLVDTDALAWAKDRAAELVGKVYHGSILVDNPNAAWSIEESTREGIKALVQSAFVDGLSPSKLANAIRDSFEFSASRSETIARTETARASIQGALYGWKKSGVVELKESLLSNDHDKDDECDEAAADGPIELDDNFSNGDDGPPYHPNCDCILAASVVESEL